VYVQMEYDELLDDSDEEGDRRVTTRKVRMPMPKRYVHKLGAFASGVRVATLVPERPLALVGGVAS